MNQWKIVSIDRMIREGLAYQAQTRYILEDFVGRNRRDHPETETPCEQDTTVFTRIDDGTQESLASTTMNDSRHFTETLNTAHTTPTSTSGPHLWHGGQGLEQALERLQKFTRRDTEEPFLFPFAIVPDDLQAPVSTPFRVTLDSGCKLNWISTSILKRSGLEEKQEEVKGKRTWLGFNGQPLVPQARITLTWYSVNAARTRRHEFLVHDQVPFDAVLGSQFIMEEDGWIDSFNDPVLALRHSGLSDEKLDEIHHKARQNKAAAESQRHVEREMRSRDRQARRQFGLSKNGTPRSFLSPAGSRSLSRRKSITTVTGHSSPPKPPLSLQQSQSTTSENRTISDSPGPLSTATTQQDATSSDLEVTPVGPSLAIEPETKRGPAREV